jgi:hypothetical protein
MNMLPIDQCSITRIYSHGPSKSSSYPLNGCSAMEKVGHTSIFCYKTCSGRLPTRSETQKRTTLDKRRSRVLRSNAVVFRQLSVRVDSINREYMDEMVGLSSTHSEKRIRNTGRKTRRAKTTYETYANMGKITLKLIITG